MGLRRFIFILLVAAALFSLCSCERAQEKQPELSLVYEDEYYTLYDSRFLAKVTYPSYFIAAISGYVEDYETEEVFASTIDRSINLESHLLGDCHISIIFQFGSAGGWLSTFYGATETLDIETDSGKTGKMKIRQDETGYLMVYILADNEGIYANIFLTHDKYDELYPIVIDILKSLDVYYPNE